MKERYLFRIGLNKEDGRIVENVDLMSIRPRKVLSITKDDIIINIPYEKINEYIKENGTTNKTLEDTVSLMLSGDYKERFKAEYIQVKNRCENLEEMLEKWDYNKLSFTPKCPRSAYQFQLRAMKDYKDILEIRAKIEEIDL